MPLIWYMVCLGANMHVIQSQLINYSFDDRTQKQIKLVRWWILEKVMAGSEEEEVASPFTDEQEAIFINFMDDHPENFPIHKREIFTSQSLRPPSLDYEDQDSDIEKPCVLLIRSKPGDLPGNICRRMDIVLQNDELPIQLPFDLAGEIILETA